MRSECKRHLQSCDVRAEGTSWTVQPKWLIFLETFLCMILCRLTRLTSLFVVLNQVCIYTVMCNVFIINYSVKIKKLHLQPKISDLPDV